jgi:hypothetical protein
MIWVISSVTGTGFNGRSKSLLIVRSQEISMFLILFGASPCCHDFINNCIATDDLDGLSIIIGIKWF